MLTQPNVQYSPLPTTEQEAVKASQHAFSSQTQNQPGQQSLPHNHHHHHHHVHPSHHHHHHHHHHHVIDNPSGQQQQQRQLKSKSDVSTDKANNSITTILATPSVRSKPQLNIKPIESIVEKLFPDRRFIGSIVYNPTTTWETLQTRSLYGLKPTLISRFDEIKKAYKQQLKANNLSTQYIPMIPPLPQEYINSIIEVKIPFRYIVEFKQDYSNELVSRELWGGASGVYTDDSDILQVLLHMGFFNDSIDLSVWNKKWTKKDILKPINVLHQTSKEVSNQGSSKSESTIERAEQQIQENPENSVKDETTPIQSVDQDVFGDLSVQILLLPSLPSYHGFFANGINSRSWNLSQSANNQHSGLSYVVYNIKWEERGSFLQDKSLLRGVEVENEVDYELNHELMREKGGWNFDYDTYNRIKESYKERGEVS